MFDRIAIELARGTDGATTWQADAVIGLVRDCAHHGVTAVELGGEPLAFPGILEVLAALRGVVVRALVTDGRLLDGQLAPLERAAPDAVCVVLAQPHHAPAVARVIRQVRALTTVGIAASLAVVARTSRIDDALRAAAHAREAGIDDDHLVYVPDPAVQRACSRACAANPRAATITWDQHVGWCSHVRSPRPLASPTQLAVVAGLATIGFHETDERCAESRTNGRRTTR